MNKKGFEKIGKKGIIKRSLKRTLGVFIDGTSLDRATKRINRRIDLAALVKGVSSGLTPIVARYYTVIPYEDDSRQRAFLDAVRKAGLDVVVKRLPPKGVTRQVSVDIQMAADMIAFGLGTNEFKDIGYNFKGPTSEKDENQGFEKNESDPNVLNSEEVKLNHDNLNQSSSAQLISNEKRIVTAVCPARDLSYAFSLLSSFQVETITVDFGEASGRELLKSAARWIDLSTSESIWL